MNLKDCILYLPNFLDRQLCDDTVKLYQNNPHWRQHSWYNPKEDTFKEYSHDCWILDPITAEQSLNCTEKLMSHTVQALNQYCKQFGTTGMIKNQTYARLNRYDVGTHMSPHFDHIQSIFDGEKKGIPILSVIGNLNRDYLGGELVFFRKDILRMNVGDLVVFPSCFLFTHEVTPVEQGTRYSYVSWAY